MLGLHRLVVEAGQRHRGGHDLALGVPLGQAVLGLGGVAAVEAHSFHAGRRQAVGVVEGDQLHLRGVAIDMIETPGITFFVQQTHDEVVVGFAVLQAVAARRRRASLEVQGLHPREYRVGLLMLGQDLFDDVGHRQVLEHP